MQPRIQHTQIMAFLEIIMGTSLVGQKCLLQTMDPYSKSFSWIKIIGFLGVYHKLITPYHCQSNGLVISASLYDVVATMLIGSII